MHCPLASSLGTNIFSASLLLAQVIAQFEFCYQMADLEVIARNLATVISAARDLNEHVAGKALSVSDIISTYV